ncbi:MAG TPA: M50 family metallopeptidase, partial [Bacillota bacterium]|nr:M50 family metallopeptidase [Bacillota bacterium]
GLILLAAGRTNWDKWISTLMGLCILGVTLLYVRNTFGLFFGICFGLALFFIGWLLPNFINDFLLKLIGLTSVLYAVFDIKDDLLSTPVGVSDASMLAREFFGSRLFWGLLWMGLALLMAIIVFRRLVIAKSSVKNPEREELSGRAIHPIGK